VKTDTGWRTLADSVVLDRTIQPEQGCRLPDGTTIALAERNNPSSSWICPNQSNTPSKIELPISIIVRNSTFSISEEERALGKVASDLEPVSIVWYSGFVLERLYLEPMANLEQASDVAARLARLFLRYCTQEAERGDGRAESALPMLHRTYWRALYGVLQAVAKRVPEDARTSNWANIKMQIRSQPESAWLVGWLDELDLMAEYLQALHNWQEICFDDRHAWFFTDWFQPWADPAGTDWQRTRENELDATIWLPPESDPATPARTGRVLRPPGVDSHEGRARLRLLSESWYLPRYDLKNATALRVAVGQAEGDNGAWKPILRGIGPYGVSRLWAGITVGYLVTALQSDTWEILAALVTHRGRWGLIIGTLLVLITASYLVDGIRLKTGLQRRQCLERAFSIGWRAEWFALIVGSIVIGAIAPMFAPNLTGGRTFLLWLLYAQVALFVGVFAQLLFDEHPTTAPFSAP
jgi:hypothetical protein